MSGSQATGTAPGSVSLQGLDIKGVAVSGDTILAVADASYSATGGFFLSKGIYRSTDGGLNFTPVADFTKTRFKDLEIDPFPTALLHFYSFWGTSYVSATTNTVALFWVIGITIGD
jgi:hypothetical protein